CGDGSTQDFASALRTVLQRPVFSDEQIHVRALFPGELEEDLLSFRLVEPLAVFLEELVRAALALDPDEERFTVVDAAAEFLGPFREQAAGRALEKEERRTRF